MGSLLCRLPVLQFVPPSSIYAVMILFLLSLVRLVLPGVEAPQFLYLCTTWRTWCAKWLLVHVVNYSVVRSIYMHFLFPCSRRCHPCVTLSPLLPPCTCLFCIIRNSLFAGHHLKVIAVPPLRCMASFFNHLILLSAFIIVQTKVRDYLLV